MRAQKALSENDLITLSDIAIKLNITPPEISDMDIKKIESEINDIKEQLNSIESKLVWNWFISEDEIIKKRLLDKMFSLLDRNNSK